MGALDDFKRRIIVSDGGPGHFKVYKTQYWMSTWDAKLRRKHGISSEWNMYFANLGHNLCDGHAGKMKVYEIVSLYLVVCSIYVLGKFVKPKEITIRW
jgi:hypothetical protein